MSPTRNPTISPTHYPSKPPSTNPTPSPTSIVSLCVPKKQDFYMLTEEDCENERNGECRQCAFLTNQEYNELRIKADFEMEELTRFSIFKSTSPSITPFKDELKFLIVSKINGNNMVYVGRVGEINSG